MDGLDFKDEQGSLAKINGWARDRTNGRIDKVLDQIRASDQAMFLLNALYFKGDWTSQNPEITRFLQQFGRSGVPLYLLYTGKGGEPIMLPQILTAANVLDAVGKS